MASDDDRDDRPDQHDDGPGEGASLRQKLHWATGDRDAEAEALADRSPGEVTPDDAKVAVQRAHGDAGVDAPETDSQVATPADAVAVSEEDEG